MDLALETIAAGELFHIQEAYDVLLNGLKTFPERLSEQSLSRITKLPPTIREQHTENWGDDVVTGLIDTGEARSLANTILQSRTEKKEPSAKLHKG